MIYSHSEVEKKLYDFWLKNNLFDLIPKSKNTKNFSVLLPPPNITGKLHLGHAWGTSLQDCIIRYKKIQGYRTFFIPGTDHAGISTQTKFEKILVENKVDRNKMTDKQFLKELNVWALAQSNHIHKQWKSLGLALNYKYETFTLDKNVNDLIALEFKKLYDKGLIYQANKLVNWDIKLQSAISDLENIKTETKGTMWYFKYFLEGDKHTFVIVATTRPETMFADTNLVVNPKDKRYIKFLGKNFINPVNNKKLKMIADEDIKIDFGTGVMKCTPAHSFEDYAIAKRNKITKFVSCINPDGKLNKNANTKIMNFEGFDRIEARQCIVAALEKLGHLIEAKPHLHNVGKSERTGEVIEPLLSLQWFVKMSPIVGNLKKLLKNHEPSYFPPRFKNVMNEWLNKTEDWCISRQLLWGHQIPVWFHKKTKKIYVDVVPPKNVKDYVRETSVLDTWFSSGLWPLATTKYGAYKKMTSDFYPIDVLLTGWDIIFFWVARMLFQCSFIDNTVSLKNIVLTGLIRDKNNKKMSKSAGNGIDPDDMISKYGADSLRATLISGANNGEDLIFDEIKIINNRNFINKLWNANNLVSNIPDTKINVEKIDYVDKWIINEFNKVLTVYKKNMDKFAFAFAWKNILDFTWETFCNTYLELTKISNNPETKKVINYIYKQILIMLHPFIPFVTEYIYQDKYKDKKSIMVEKILTTPIKVATKHTDALLLIKIFQSIKTLRIKNSLPLSKEININIVTEQKYDIKLLNLKLNKFFTNINKISNLRDSEIKEIFVENGFTIEIVSNLSNKNDEIRKNEILLSKLKNELDRSARILSNQEFIKKASKEKVKIEEEKQREYMRQYMQVEAILKKIKK
ncbi:MAG: valine--tRNA ligase [Mycoplasmataceae bacterium]|nr:valine--tRNA ligase [Mycoplasmataceae bacterium]